MAFWSGSSIIGINTSQPNSGTGDNLFDAFNKVDNNFSNISSQLSSTSQDWLNANVEILFNAGSANITNLFSPNITTTAITLSGNVNAGNLISTNALQIAGQSFFSSNINLSANIIPTSSGVYNIGSPSNRIGTIYSQAQNISTVINNTSSAGILVVHQFANIGDSQDVGIQGNVTSDYNGSNTYAFFGHRYTTNNFSYLITNVDTTSGNNIVVPGVYGNTHFGSQFLANTTVSTNTSTGALIVSGGAGIAGNLNVGGNITATGNIYSSGTMFSGGYPVITPNSPGVGILYNAGTNFTQNVAVAINTPSTSTATGALVVTGGVGVGGNITAFGFVGPLYGQLQTAAQPSITSLGTLTGLTVTSSGTISTGVLQANNVGSSYATITNLNTTTLTATTLSGLTSLLVTANVTAGNILGAYYGTVQTPAQPNITSLGTLTGLALSGNLASTSTIYGLGVYDYGTRVVSTSSGAGNLTISANTVNLTATGPGAITVGGSANIPVITTDVFGRIATASNVAISIPSVSPITLNGTSGAGNVALGGNLTFASTNGVTIAVGSSYANISTAQDIQTTASPTFANITSSGNIISNTGYYSGNVIVHGNLTVQGVTTTVYNESVTGNIVPSANLTYNLGSTSAWWNNIYGTAVHAQYADLAEIYTADAVYTPGTVLIFGGDAEVTVTETYCDSRVAGAVSTNPAYLMNSTTTGVAVALRGRIPVRVVGPVAKGDLLVTSNTPGCAQSAGRSATLGAAVFAKAIEASDEYGEKIIEAVIL